MPRDQKVGMALGMLLVGAVAALFFRNETQSPVSAGTLRSAGSINAEIAEKSTTPYLTDEQPAVRVQTAAKTVSDSGLKIPGDSSNAAILLPPDLSDDDPFVNNGIPDPATAGPPPRPLQLELPEVNAPRASSVPTETNARVHVVKKGDSLSSLAEKYLGSQSRFGELFEANKHQLRHANDLKLGMKLIIPAAKPVVANDRPAPSVPGASAAIPGASAEPTTPPAAPTDPQTPKKFIPYRRQPLNRQTSLRSQPTGIAEDDAAGRRLTQLPPEGIR